MAKRFVVFILSFLTLGLVESRSVLAAQYFVDDISGNCSDASGSGTLSDPWHSLHYASRQVRCGDVLNLRRGTYRLNAQGFAADGCGGISSGNGKRAVGYFTQACTASSKIIVQPYQGETVIIDGTSLQIDDSSPSSHWTKCKDGGDGAGGGNDSCGTCTGLNLQNPNRTYFSEAWNFGSVDTEQVWIDPPCDDADSPGCTNPADTGTRLKQVRGGCAALGQLDGACKTGWVSPACGSFNTEALNSAVVVRLPDDAGSADPGNHLVKISCQGGTCAAVLLLFKGAKNVEVRGDGSMYFKYGYYGMRFDSRASDIAVDGVTLSGIGGADYGNAFRTGSGDNITLRNSTVRETAAECVAFYGGGNGSCVQISGNLAENNSISKCGFASSTNGRSDPLDDGILMKSCRNCTARGNEIFQTGRAGVKIRSDRNGSAKCSSDGALVEGNQIYDVCTATGAPQSDCGAVVAVPLKSGFGSVSNVTIRNNMIHDVSGRGSAAPHGIKIDSGVRSVTIANNSIRGVDAECIDTNENRVGNGNFIVRNNALVDCNVAKVGGAAFVRMNAEGDWVHSNNDYWGGSGTTDAIKLNLPTSTAIKRDQVVPQFESTAIQASPGFVALDDLHLVSGSALVDAGTNQNAPSLGIDGDPRPQGLGWDVGADEFSGATAAPVLLSVQPFQ